MANPPNDEPRGDQGQKQPEATPAITGGPPDEQSRRPAHNDVSFGKTHRSAIEAVGLLLGVVVVALGAMSWLEDKVDKVVERKLNDPAILHKIAEQSRPILIFNAAEAITSDMGAGKFIKDIHVSAFDGLGCPTNILVDLTEHFPNAPILTTPLGLPLIVPKRGRMNAWEFDLDWGSVRPNPQKTLLLFHLELVR